MARRRPKQLTHRPSAPWLIAAWAAAVLAVEAVRFALPAAPVVPAPSYVCVPHMSGQALLCTPVRQGD